MIFQIQISNLLIQFQMQKYEVIKKLGSGSFGNVQMASDRNTGQIVAIKRLKKKYGTWQQCLQLSEVKALRRMSHPNIIKLKEVIRVINEAYFVFEYIQKDLYRTMQERKERGKKMQENQIRLLSRQLAQALLYIHKQGYIHRDLKPENLLLTPELILKVIDFGIARQIRSKPPFTQYVATRWYRAPQLLFRFPTYSATVDVFAMGCIVAEMYLGRPLFLGNSEMDQISKIVSVLGTPSVSWPQGMKQATKKGIGIPEYPQIPLSTVIANCPADALSFITQCLRWDPTKRISTSQMLFHPFLSKQIEIKSIKQINFQQKKQQKAQQPKLSKKQTKPKKNDEFDMLLNDFKNYQIGSAKKKEQEQQQWN